MALPLAHRLEGVEMEAAFTVLAEVEALRRQGRDIISFAIGEPDYPTPAHIVEAAIEALRRGEGKYAPSAGILPLREAVAEHVEATRGVKVSPEEVVIVPGGKPILFYGILACVNPGEEVLYPNPGFPVYESIIRLAGAVPVPLSLPEERGFRLDPEEVAARITPRTRMILLNSPHNPCGSVLSPSDVERIAALAERHHLWVLSDEIYSRLLYDAPFLSPLSLEGMKERTILLDGFSKAYSMTGWRLGYGVVPRPLAEAITRLVVNSVSCVPPFVQWAGVAALRGPQEPVREWVATLRRRREAMVKGLNALPGVRCLWPQGAFYAYANVTEVCQRLSLPHAEALQERWLREAGVATLARTCFGSRLPGEEQEYLRFSYATSLERIQEGLERLRQWLQSQGL